MRMLDRPIYLEIISFINEMVELCEILQTWTRFGRVGTSSARSSLDVNL